jgi:dihydroorotase
MIVMVLIQKQGFEWLDIIEKMTLAPARILKEPGGFIKTGTVADLTIIDPEKKWRLTSSAIRSKSKNSPLLNKTLTGKCAGVFVSGEVKYLASK